MKEIYWHVILIKRTFYVSEFVEDLNIILEIIIKENKQIKNSSNKLQCLPEPEIQT